MPKRKIDVVDGPAHTLKRRRRRVRLLVRLDDISDELVLRILSFLSPNELGLTARLSRRFLRLVNDNESWKERYYERWVRPRVLQTPSTTPWSARDIPRYSAKSANWLDHRHLVIPSKTTDWKWQYRVRNNWHRGTCNLQVLEVVQPPTAPAIIKIHHGVVFEASSTGIQAFANKKGGLPIASELFEPDNKHKASPTAMAIDTSCDILRLGIGFSDSSFRCYGYSQTTGFVQSCAPQHFLDHLEAVSVLSMSFPHVFALIGSTNFLLQRLPAEVSTEFCIWEELAWLQAGRRHECLPSLALRRVGKEVVASIAYACGLLGGSGWCLGIQEFRVFDAHDSTLRETTPPLPLRSSNEGSQASDESQLQMRTLDAWTPAFPTHPTVDCRPKALSYSHPYLLAALPDNTMMVYLVTSTSNKLAISQGSRLWGHTSGISGAEVNGRGKAVTTSTKGGEIRVWDLEGLACGISQGKTSTPLVPIPELVPGRLSNKPPSATSDAGLKVDHDQLAFIRSWIAFDDEQVLVLGEAGNARTLARYDFTR